jgi:hypothetical protein
MLHPMFYVEVALLLLQHTDVACANISQVLTVHQATEHATVVMVLMEHNKSDKFYDV